jgi:hypothetical protein
MLTLPPVFGTYSKAQAQSNLMISEEARALA